MGASEFASIQTAPAFDINLAKDPIENERPEEAPISKMMQYTPKKPTRAGFVFDPKRKQLNARKAK